jgi:hypothetical protein
MSLPSEEEKKDDDKVLRVFRTLVEHNRDTVDALLLLDHKSSEPPVVPKSPVLSIDTTTVDDGDASPTSVQEDPPFNSPAGSKQDETELVVERKKKIGPMCVFWWCRTLLIDLPLATVFASFLLAYIVREVHNDYYRPLFDRAQRTNDDLFSEYTYYDRPCNEYDLSTHNLSDLILVNNSNVSVAMDQMMTHGAILIPQILPLATVQALRAYIVQRNAQVTDDEAYPVSQSSYQDQTRLRLSYGIDATEDPAVEAAIRAVATNAPLLRQLVQGLVGDVDPASAEITAITAYAGCIDQIWHSDTKADGNALKYARTYSHSYSLFLPLQDTTEAMGPTDICPGTHYCANDLADLCEENKLGMHLATSERVFRAGDGALLNQHVWHRGSAHSDPEAPERIVFILSFLARPKFGKDPRQLSRGTYFHMKWNMWGHTWKDLMDPYLSMKTPFSILRCLHLWKPAAYNWGYDLVTSGFMRFSNGQLEDDDLSERLLPNLDKIGFPVALRGRILEDVDMKEIWEVFLQESIDNTFDFLKALNFWIHGGYVLLVVLASLLLMIVRRPGKEKRGRLRLLRVATCRVFLTHGVLMALTYGALNRTRKSRWGLDILSGRTLMRPFPPVSLARDDDAAFVSAGPTTLPQRTDVLIGTRFDSPFLGAYDRWLDFHPGNVVFRRTTGELASRYRDYGDIDILFSRRLEQRVAELVTEQDGRFLHQDYRTGDWRVMTNAEVKKVVQEELLSSGSALLFSLVKSVAWMMADYRFGTIRGTALASMSQLYLNHLRQRIFSVEAGPHTTSVTKESLLKGPKVQIRPAAIWQRRTMLSPIFTSRRRAVMPLRCGIPNMTRRQDDLRVGSLVWVVYEDDWLPGSIMAIHDDGRRLDVSFDDGTKDVGIDREKVKKLTPVTEGNSAIGCFDEGFENCFDGVIEYVAASGRAMIQFDDGEVEWAMNPDYYYVPPFRYGWTYS